MNHPISPNSILAPAIPFIVAILGAMPDAPTGSTQFEIEDSCLRATGGEWKAAFDMSSPKLSAHKAQFDAVKAQIAKIMADKKAADDDAIANPPPPTAEQLDEKADIEEGKAVASLLASVADSTAKPEEKDRVLAWLLKRELKRQPRFP